MRSMTNLPQEIQLEILAYCDRQDAAALRLLHRAWLNTATDALFSEHRTCLFRWSFDRLSELSHSRLAGRVRAVTFYSAAVGECYEYPGDENDEEAQRLGVGYADFKRRLSPVIDGSCECTGPRGLIYRIPKPEWPQAWAAYNIFTKAQSQLDAKDFDIFNQALKRLPQLRALSIRFFSRDDLDIRTRFTRKAVSWTSENESLTLAREMAWTVKRDNRAAHDTVSKLIPCMAGLSLRRLQIHQQYDYSWRVEHLRLVLQQLQELELDLTTEYYNGSEGDRRRDAMYAAAVSLVKCPRLQSLTLFVGSAQDQLRVPRNALPQADFDALFASYTWPDLRSLTMRADLSNRAMLGLLRRHELKSLNMQDCWLEDVIAVFRQMPSLVTLDSIAVTNLREQHKRGPNFIYFREGLDETTRLWLCSQSEVEPTWKPEPVRLDNICSICHRFQGPSNDDVVLDEVWD